MQVLLIRNGNVGYVRLLLSCKYTVVSMYYVPSQCIRYSSVVIIILLLLLTNNVNIIMRYYYKPLCT